MNNNFLFFNHLSQFLGDFSQMANLPKMGDAFLLLMMHSPFSHDVSAVAVHYLIF